MSKFPLYDSLSKNIGSAILSKSSKKKFIKLLETIDFDGQELIYALIRMYQIENDEKNISFPALINDFWFQF